ncbi:aspartic peptidase domain-containing protein [Syncephalastrum racemosum]|uniref:Aspartic peptidase domain-containing protein n=1 Tax=Syncephalastrum racemosum TaxID=13706 RepID=A0A1X2HI32_SYNRA|nr:aspartic peptidase domain-containing protein [Syncephalastrum racemosum]
MYYLLTLSIWTVAASAIAHLPETNGKAHSAKLYNDQGSQYLVQVGVGSPAQDFTVTLDTGSADLWIPSSQCPQTQCPFGGFQQDQSSSFKDLQQSFGIQYGIGSVNGTYATDTVSVSGASVQDQQFGLATTTQDILTVPSQSGGGHQDASQSNDTIANGILGLGYPQLTAATTQGEPAYNPFVFNLVEQKVIPEPVFSVYMNSANQQGWAGELLLGGIDQSKYTGDLHYLPVAQLTTQQNPLPYDGEPGQEEQSGNGRDGFYYWMVYGQGIAVKVANESQPKQYTLPQIGAFILDTGTTLTYMPTKYAIQVATAIAGRNFQLDRQSGVLVVDCSVANSDAQVQLQMSQTSKISETPAVTLSVPASELVIPLDGDTPQTASTCMLGIAPLGDSGGGLGSNMFLVGDSILRSAYLVFDMGKNQVGLAAANGVGGSVNGVDASSSSPSSTAGTGFEGSDATSLAPSALGASLVVMAMLVLTIYQ